MYREGQHSELCGECRAPAALACVRCAEPLCEAHQHQAERRCDICEANYLFHYTRTVRRAVIPGIVAACGALFAGAFGLHLARNGFLSGPNDHYVASGMLYGGAALLGGVFAGAPILGRYLRKRFLRERASTPASSD